MDAALSTTSCLLSMDYIRTRFNCRDIHFKPYTEEEFVEIVVNVLDGEEDVDRDIALLIANRVYNRLKSSNIRECVRIARLAKNDSTQVNRIIDTFAKYGMN
jgi:Cdc6-like AAA superfamily ATPase